MDLNIHILTHTYSQIPINPARTHSFTSKPLQSQSESALGQTGEQIDREPDRQTDRQSVIQTKHGRKAQLQRQASIYEARSTHTFTFMYMYKCISLKGHQLGDTHQCNNKCHFANVYEQKLTIITTTMTTSTCHNRPALNATVLYFSALECVCVYVSTRIRICRVFCQRHSAQWPQSVSHNSKRFMSFPCTSLVFCLWHFGHLHS